MKTIHEFIQAHVQRGACQCGRCIDAPDKPEENQPTGHTADLIFFKVSATNNPDVEELKACIKAHKGDYAEVDLFDGEEHGYTEIGGWIGDQGFALMLMGLGSLLGLWKLMTPRSMLGNLVPEEMIMKMAGAGMVTIQAPKTA